MLKSESRQHRKQTNKNLHRRGIRRASRSHVLQHRRVESLHSVHDPGVLLGVHELDGTQSAGHSTEQRKARTK
jgi:hypothetical protein